MTTSHCILHERWNKQCTTTLWTWKSIINFIQIFDSQASILEDHLLLEIRTDLHRFYDYSCKCRKRIMSTNKFSKWTLVLKNTQGNHYGIHLHIRWKKCCLRLEMPRDHPNLVHHSQYHTQAWRANGDISNIVTKNNPILPYLKIHHVYRTICFRIGMQRKHRYRGTAWFTQRSNPFTKHWYQSQREKPM